MHELGLRGMPRRVADYLPDLGWSFLNQLATAGSFVIAVSLAVFLVNVVVTLRRPRTARGRPVGGQHPGVGDQLAAARPQLRPAARGALQPAGRDARERARDPGGGGSGMSRGST